MAILLSIKLYNVYFQIKINIFSIIGDTKFINESDSPFSGLDTKIALSFFTFQKYPAEAVRTFHIFHKGI